MNTKMNTSYWTGSAITLLLLGGAAHARQTPPQVTITDLGLLPGGIYASAYGINDTGKIVGMAYDANFNLVTVEWVNGQISVIPTLAPGFAYVPEDVNDAGEITGTDNIGHGLSEAIYWDSQNNPFQLPGLPPNGSPIYGVKAHAINASGQIVGIASEGGPNFWGHAVIWQQTSFQTDLGFMGGGTYSNAFGINDLGAVVGAATVANTNLHAFLWQGGQYTDLSTWSGGGPASTAYAINNHGVIVGLNANVASIWENGAVHPLPMPPGVSAYTPAIDINDAGDIIATGSTGYPFDVGVLWRNGTAVSLGTLPGGTISRARRINAAGEIVGEANAANGYFHAVKWTVTGLDNPLTAFCLPGQAGVHACPCNNPPAGNGQGCNNFGAGPADSATLTGAGTAAIASDTLVFTSSGENNTSFTIFAQGTTQLPAGAVFGAGVRCVAGALKRLYVGNAAGGTIVRPGGSDPSVHVRSAALGYTIVPPITLYYFAYYRDPAAAGPCGSSTATFNATQAGAVLWQ
jgi:probable HAF family extracellular repeat protein